MDASLKAIESHVQSGAEMVLYLVNAISGSTESQGEVTVRLQNSGRVVNRVGSDPDIDGGICQSLFKRLEQVLK